MKIKQSDRIIWEYTWNVFINTMQYDVITHSETAFLPIIIKEMNNRKLKGTVLTFCDVSWLSS